MRFFESHLFTAKVQAIRGEEPLRELQLFLTEQPEAGKALAGTAGFCKV